MWVVIIYHTRKQYDRSLYLMHHLYLWVVFISARSQQAISWVSPTSNSSLPFITTISSRRLRSHSLSTLYKTYTRWVIYDVYCSYVKVQFSLLPIGGLFACHSIYIRLETRSLRPTVDRQTAVISHHLLVSRVLNVYSYFIVSFITYVIV